VGVRPGKWPKRGIQTNQPGPFERC
jgi:hypothetical protein